MSDRDCIMQADYQNPVQNHTHYMNNTASAKSWSERKNTSLADLPMPSIYISTQRIDSEILSTRDQTVHFSIPHPTQKNNPLHLFLILEGHQQFTKEEIEHANHRYPCFNCGRKFPGLIHFIPIERSNSHTEFRCSPIPHCRPACVLRTIGDMPMPANTNKKGLYFEIYGYSEVMAPPRMLLFLPGGLSIEQYHQWIDDRIVITEEKQMPNSSNIMTRSFLAPIYLSMTVLQTNGMKSVPSLIDAMDQLHLEEKATMGMKSSFTPSDLPLKPLATPSLFSNDMIVPPHPVSFDDAIDVHAHSHPILES